MRAVGVATGIYPEVLLTAAAGVPVTNWDFHILEEGLNDPAFLPALGLSSE